eukprot:g7118.t1
MRARQDEQRRMDLLGAGAVCALALAGGWRFRALLQRERAAGAPLRTRARDLADEVEQIQARAARDVEAASKFGISKFAKELLDVADNLERAVVSAGGGGGGGGGSGSGGGGGGSGGGFDGGGSGGEHSGARELLAGVRMTKAQLQKAFAAHGIVRFGAVGDAFDPHRHEAMFEIESARVGVGQESGQELQPGTIAQLLKPGYLLHERVLRPAQVATASTKLAKRGQGQVEDESG